MHNGDLNPVGQICNNLAPGAGRKPESGARLSIADYSRGQLATLELTEDIRVIEHLP